MSERRLAELEGGRRFVECSSKKTISSRIPVLLTSVPVLLAWVSIPCEFDAIGIAISPVLPPIGTHRNRGWGFVESQQKSPFRSGGMSLDAFGTIAKYRYLRPTGARIPTATLVKADRFRAPHFLSVYFTQIGGHTTDSMVYLNDVSQAIYDSDYDICQD